MHLQYSNAAICIISNLIVLGFVFELLNNIAHWAISLKWTATLEKFYAHISGDELLYSAVNNSSGTVISLQQYSSPSPTKFSTKNQLYLVEIPNILQSQKPLEAAASPHHVMLYIWTSETIVWSTMPGFEVNMG